MKRKLSLVILAAMIGALCLGTPAMALIVLPGWNFDFSSLGGGTFNDIEQLTYTGIAHANVNDTNGNVAPDPGETFITDGLLSITGYTDTNGVTQTFAPSNYLTAAFSVDGTFTDNAGHFTHNAATNTTGTLDIYWDNTNDASTSTGDGFQNGTLIASFQILAGQGGVFNVPTFDGSDDGNFAYTGGAVAGVITDLNGNDIAKNTLIALTDSNFDADPTNKNAFSIAAPSSWPVTIAGSNTATRTGAGTPVAFYAKEDGSVSLGVVPEPGTIALLGLGLLGLGFVGRKKLIN
jgi:hypothetical protein